MKRRRIDLTHIKTYIPLLLLVAVLAIFLLAANQIGNTQASNEKEILDKALNRSITECYALEGAYPSSLDYLTQHYGLTYDADEFYIDYQYIGSNLRPTVMIIERKN